MTIRRTVLLLLAFCCAAGLSAAAEPEPIRYTLRFPSPSSNTFEVEARVPTEGREAIELMMPVWFTGSYLVREPARNVEELSASTPDGKALAVEKSRKNRWRIASAGAPEVVVRYRLYARDLSVRANFVDSSFAMINGAPTFLTLAESPPRRHEVTVAPPGFWSVAVSPLAEGRAIRFDAPDYDALIDAPLYLGNAQVLQFVVAGRPHMLLNEGGEGTWDGPLSMADTAAVVRETVALWGSAPYPRYVFFNLLTETGGGLEHRDSTVLMSSRYRLRTREGHLDWLSLVSHELFHAWNVKRLRPIALGPFDYESEVYTRDLWIAEGWTSYYADLLVARAGLMSRKEYLKRLSEDIERLETVPGRLVQPLADASYDAWIKFYRRDENSDNTAVSYYTKGAIVGFLLDARIRRATGGTKSLDDVMRRAYELYSGERGYRSEEIRAVASEVAGTDLGGWFAETVDTAGELDYREALEWYGLIFKEPEQKEEEKDELPAAWLGAETKIEDGRLVVTEVKRGTPAHAAGVNVDDELLAIDDVRIPPEELDERLKAHRPGEQASLLLARRQRLLRVQATFGEKPKNRWKLAESPDATPEQKARLEAWLKTLQAASPGAP